VRFHQIGELPDQPPALGRGHPAPLTALEGPASGLHSPINILLITFSDLGEDVARGWIIGGKGLSRCSRYPFVPDQHLSRLADKSAHPLIDPNLRYRRSHLPSPSCVLQ
jgi:hypothetical protein